MFPVFPPLFGCSCISYERSCGQCNSVRENGFAKRRSTYWCPVYHSRTSQYTDIFPGAVDLGEDTSVG